MVRHFLDIADFDAATLRGILAEAVRLKAGRRKPGAPRPFAGKTLAMIFDKQSTRTRVSFDVAMRDLGGETIVLSSSDQKLEKARALGAAATINYKSVPAWEEEVLALTDGRGVDHVIEVVGGDNLNRSLRAVRVNGTIRVIGALAVRYNLSS